MAGLIFPDAIQAYVAQEDALAAGDIGIENSTPEVIAAAIEKALANAEHMERGSKPLSSENVTMSDLAKMGLVGADGASELRAAVCAKLGIGHGNAKAVVRKLEHWGIGIKELEQAIEEVK